MHFRLIRRRAAVALRQSLGDRMAFRRSDAQKAAGWTFDEILTDYEAGHGWTREVAA